MNRKNVLKTKKIFKKPAIEEDLPKKIVEDSFKTFFKDSKHLMIIGATFLFLFILVIGFNYKINHQTNNIEIKESVKTQEIKTTETKNTEQNNMSPEMRQIDNTLAFIQKYMIVFGVIGMIWMVYRTVRSVDF